MLVLNSQNLIVPFPYKSAHHSMIMYFATSGLIDTSQDFFYGLTVEELEYFISVANKFDRVAANASLCELHAYATGILTPEEYASWQSVCSSHPNLETLTAAYPDLNVDNKTFVMPVRHPVDRMMSTYFFVTDGWGANLRGFIGNNPEEQAAKTLAAIGTRLYNTDQAAYLPTSGTKQLFRLGSDFHTNVAACIENLGGTVSGEWHLNNNATRERDYTTLLTATTIQDLETALAGDVAVWNAAV
jgi:hypothetical protein|tara:strand:- start:1422 stop:2153 length:732 start_codon:yes stop_codon:yes gene_type:complete